MVTSAPICEFTAIALESSDLKVEGLQRSSLSGFRRSGTMASTAQSESSSAAPDITATPIAPPAPETPTASIQPTTASPSAEATKDASDFAAKYTQALLANIHASTFAETCGRSRSLGGHAWACVIDHLASSDDETIEIYLTSSDVLLRETSQAPTIYGAVATMVSNTCVYHFAFIAPDGQRKDFYNQMCRRLRR